jgi:hypothetical protein
MAREQAQKFAKSSPTAPHKEKAQGFRSGLLSSKFCNDQ